MIDFLEAAYLWLTLFFMLLGLFGLLFPVIPGLFIMWLSALGYGVVSGFDTLGIVMFVLITLLAVGGSLADNLFMGAGARWGGACWGTILVALLWRVIDTFRIFDVIYLLTAGGPARATETVSIYVYRYGFQSFNLGFASASSYIMILIIIHIAVVLARLMGRIES